VTTVYCDFENPKKYREAVTLFHTARGCSVYQPPTPNPQPGIFVAPPRIFKPGEEWTLEQVRSCNADGYLVRNYEHLRYFANDRRVGDFSLTWRIISADYFKSSLERDGEYDLNFQQLEALLRAAPAEWFEVTIHQHMPMFHMEHCVFCAFLSSGTDYTNCGRPCDVHDVKLRDRVGAEHPVKADVGCRNTVFNGRPDRRRTCRWFLARRALFPPRIPGRVSRGRESHHFEVPEPGGGEVSGPALARAAAPPSTMSRAR
jgi:putative protease